jgi:hypothetical protein
MTICPVCLWEGGTFAFYRWRIFCDEKNVNGYFFMFMVVCLLTVYFLLAIAKFIINYDRACYTNILYNDSDKYPEISLTKIP